ncbi:MAG: hypothetical protein AAGD25_10055 [Cyanobacteria bacterium P01_F01_bin.150]
MPNPHPVQTTEFKTKQFKPISELPDEPLAKQPLAVKVPQSIDAWVRSKSQKERIEWLRGVITDAALKEMSRAQVVEATEQSSGEPSPPATVTTDCIYRRRVMDALDWEDYRVHTVYVWTPVQVAKRGRSRITICDPLNGTSEREQYPRRTKLFLPLDRLDVGELIEDLDEFGYCLDFRHHLEQSNDNVFNVLSAGCKNVPSLTHLETVTRLRVSEGIMEQSQIPVAEVRESEIVIFDERVREFGQVIPLHLERSLLELGEVIHQPTTGAMGDHLYCLDGSIADQSSFS